MTMDGRALGRRISQVIHKQLRTADQFWVKIGEEIVDHIRKYMEVAEIIKMISVTSSSTTLKDEDAVVLVYTVNSGGFRTVTLPASAEEGRVICVKDAGGHAGTQNIHIQAGLRLIDGNVNVVLNKNWASSVCIFKGGAWYTVAGADGGGGGTPAPPTPLILPLSGKAVGDSSGWTVAGRCRWTGEGIATIECEGTGFISLFDVTNAPATQVGSDKTLVGVDHKQITINIPSGPERVFELRVKDDCIIWSSYIKEV